MKRYLTILLALAFGFTAYSVPAQTTVVSAKPEAYVFDKFRMTNAKAIAARVEWFYQTLNKERSQGYIINYGTNREILNAEKLIAAIPRKGCDFDCGRLTLVRGENSKKALTVLWVLPEGANAPSP